MRMTAAEWVEASAQTRVPEKLPWLAHLREQALAQFIKLGLPTRAHEAWKYTNVSFLTEQPLRLAQPNTQFNSTTLSPYLSHTTPSAKMVFVDGFFNPALSTLTAEIGVTHLTDAIKTKPQWVQNILSQAVAVEEQPFWLLNQAFMQDGVVVDVPEAHTLQPLELIFVTTENAQHCSQQNRHLIVLGRQAKATITEHHISIGKPTTLASHAMTILVGDRATLQYAKLQNQADTVTHVANTKLSQGEHSQVAAHVIMLGGRVARDRFDVVQHKTGASFRANGLCLPNQQQHMDFHVTLTHQAPHGFSDVLFKGVLGDRATAVFNGKIMVAKAAGQVEAHLRNNNLLLSPHCAMNSKPVLEIYHDDVQCSHGATCGSLDKEQLFYCQSRGIALDDAQRLLTLAFVKEVMTSLDESVYNSIKVHCERKLMQDLQTVASDVT